MMHCLKSMAYQPKKDIDSKDKTIITVSKINGKDDKGDYTNYMFDLFDPTTKIMKIGMVIKRGDDIFYKEDPGMETVEKITKAELLKKLPLESELDSTTSKYTGDLSQIKELIVEIKSLCKDEKDKIYLKNDSLDKKNTSQSIDNKVKKSTTEMTMKNLKEPVYNKIQQPTNLDDNSSLNKLLLENKIMKNNIINKNNNGLNNSENFINYNNNQKKVNTCSSIYDDLNLREQELLNEQSLLSTMIEESGIKI